MGQNSSMSPQNPNLGTQLMQNLDGPMGIPSPDQRQMAMGLSPESAPQGSFGNMGAAAGGKPMGRAPQKPMAPQGPENLAMANSRSPAAQGDFRQRLAGIMTQMGNKFRTQPMGQGPRSL